MKHALSLTLIIALVFGISIYTEYAKKSGIAKITEMANEQTPEPETASFVKEIDEAQGKESKKISVGLYVKEIVEGDKKAKAEFYFKDESNYTASLKVSEGGNDLYTGAVKGTYEIKGQTITFKPTDGAFALANGRYILTGVTDTSFTLKRNEKSPDTYQKNI